MTRPVANAGYRSAFCGQEPTRHNQCHGTYAGTGCDCRCHELATACLAVSKSRNQEELLDALEALAYRTIDWCDVLERALASQNRTPAAAPASQTIGGAP